MRASIDQCGKQREAGLSGEISLDNTPNPLPCYSSKSAVIVSKSRADPWGELRWEAARRKGGHRGRTGSNSLESSVGMERGGSMDIVDGQETVGNSLGKAPVGGSETEAWTSWTDRKPWELGKKFFSGVRSGFHFARRSVHRCLVFAPFAAKQTKREPKHRICISVNGQVGK